MYKFYIIINILFVSQSKSLKPMCYNKPRGTLAPTRIQTAYRNKCDYLKYLLLQTLVKIIHYCKRKNVNYRVQHKLTRIYVY